MKKGIVLIVSLLIFIVSCIYSVARGEEWTISLNPTEEITTFKLIDGNAAILVGVIDTNPVTKKEVYKVLKLGLPEGNKYWERQYPRPIAKFLSTPNEQYFYIAFYWIEEELNIIRIIDKEGKIIVSFVPREWIEQRKVFLINDSYYITAIEPGGGGCGDEYLEKFSTVIEIRSLPGNKIVRSLDIGGELIDVVPWGSQGARMIVSKGKIPGRIEPEGTFEQELLQSRDIVKSWISNIGNVSKGVARNDMDDFFIDENTIVSESDYYNRYSLHISQDGVTRVPLEIIKSEVEMPDDILYFKKYWRTVLYFLNRGGNKVISIAINEGKENPFNLLRKYSGESERIELRRSAFYRIGKEAFFLQIPKKERNKIIIKKVE